MAVNLDTRLPLAAIGNPLNPAGVMQNARANAIQQKLDEMRVDYESRKRRRETDTERYMGEAINAIRQGRPAQTVTDFQWNTPNQTGVPQSPYEVSAREIAPAVPGRQPTLEDMQAAGIDAMFKAGDLQGAFKAMKAARQTGNEYFGGLTPTDQGYVAMTKRGPQLTQFKPPAKEEKEAPLVKVETDRGIQFVRPTEGAVYNPPAKEVKPDMSPYQRIQTEGGLRDDYRNDSKNYAEIKRQSAIIKAALNDPSAAGTLSAATAYMKMLDPGSVVRESELGMAMNTQGAIDRLASYWATIEMGKVLTPQQKADFARLSDLYVKAAEEAQRNINKRYSDIATGYGLDPKRVVMYEVGSQQKPQPAARSIKTASDWLKTRSIKTQQQFAAEVAKLKKSGWTDDEIRQAARDAGL
jgi:hypothetical protein